MAEQHTIRIDKSVKKYLDGIPEDRKALVNRLHSIIIELFPDISVDMQYKMPTYHSGDGWVALANQKNYVSLYTCGYHHIKAFKEKYPKIKTGKGCINFKTRDALPEQDIKNVIRHAIQHPKPQ